MNLLTLSIILILILALVIVGSAAVIYQFRALACERNPELWCFSDWRCEENGTEVEVSRKVDEVRDRCQPLTPETLAQIPAGEINPDTGEPYQVDEIYWGWCCMPSAYAYNSNDPTVCRGVFNPTPRVRFSTEKRI